METVSIVELIADYRAKQRAHTEARAAEANARQELNIAGETVTAHLVEHATKAGQIGAEFYATAAGTRQMVKIVAIRGHWRDRSKVVPHAAIKVNDGKAWGKKEYPIHDLAWDHINAKWRKIVEAGDGSFRFEEQLQDKSEGTANVI